MRFGFMDHLPCAEWQSEVQRYHDILALPESYQALQKAVDRLKGITYRGAWLSMLR